MKLQSEKKNERFLDFMIFLAALAFFSLTLYKGVGGVESYGNSTKFQYIGVILGVPHSPGFPLYVLINYLWSHIPVAISIATKISLLSAVFAAMALVFFRRALALMNVNFFEAIGATAALALSGVFWVRATEAGVGSMSYLLSAATLFFILRCVQKKNKSDLAYSIIFIFLSAWHDPLLLALAPFALLFLIISNPTSWLKKTAWISVGIGILIGVALYSFIYVRSHQRAPVLEYVYAMTTVKRVFLTALNGQFWPNYFVAGPKIILQFRLPELLKETSAQLTTAVFLFSIFGLFFIYKKSRAGAPAFLIFLTLSFILKAHLYSANLLGEYWLFYMLAAFLTGLGLQFISNYRKNLGVFLTGAFLALVLFNAYTHNKDLLFRNNKNEFDGLLTACTYNSNLLASDKYKWQEILLYYNLTNPYVKKRKIKLIDSFNFYNRSTNFFFETSVKEQLDEAGIPYFPVYSNDTATLYLINNL